LDIYFPQFAHMKGEAEVFAREVADFAREVLK
jgi:hypothetical protein